MLYTILIFRDFIFKENALFTYFIVFFLYETVKTTESILNSDDIVYPFLIFRLFVFVPHFVDVYVYAGTINRPLRLLAVCQNVANGLEFRGCLRICKHHKIVHQRTLATCYNTTTYTECLLSHCKNHTFAM